MKHKLYKNVIMLFAIGFIANTFAQKFDKKYVENFTVNKDVEVVINASNTEINVTNWDKNEVQIEAFIEVEGLSKEEAEKYFKSWNFEALGNKAKVKITSLGNHSTHLRNDFIIHDNIDFTIPDIQMPDFDSIIIPDMNFDFDYTNLVNNLDNLGENIGENGEHSFMYSDDEHHVVIKTKKEWEAFKKTKKYQELKEKMSFDKEELKKNLAESKERLRVDLAKAKLEFQKIDREEIKKQLAEAKKQIMNMRNSFNSNSDDMTINGKKINIKKRLEIKVPKNAVFNLNTRHSKVKLPKTVASGNVKYGSFNADNLIGGRLNIDFSKVTIDDLNGCTLFLNNVTDAKIASVTNTTMHNNSSGVKIETINENVDIHSKFGELKISSIITNYKQFSLFLDNSEAELNLSNLSEFPNFSTTSIELSEKGANKLKGTILKGTINAENKNNTIKIEGKHSELTIIK